MLPVCLRERCFVNVGSCLNHSEGWLNRPWTPSPTPQRFFCRTSGEQVFRPRSLVQHFPGRYCWQGRGGGVKGLPPEHYNLGLEETLEQEGYRATVTVPFSWQTSHLSEWLLCSHWLCGPRRGSLCPTVSSEGGGRSLAAAGALLGNRPWRDSPPFLPAPSPQCPNLPGVQSRLISQETEQEKCPLCTNSMTRLTVMNAPPK